MEAYLISDVKFQLYLLKAIQKFVARHGIELLRKSGVNYMEYGSESQIRLKWIVRYYFNMRTVLNDLDKTLEFLRKDRAFILVHYPFLDYQEDYFKYHFENYYIRLITLLDLTAKIGSILYGLNSDLKKMSAYILKDKLRKLGYENVAKILDDLIAKLNELKALRHEKLHTGESKFELFNGIVIWEDLKTINLDPSFDLDISDELIRDTDKKIKEKIDDLRKDTLEFIDLVKRFFEESRGELSKLSIAANKT